MRWLSRRSFAALLVLSVLTLLLATACTGPEGQKGPAGPKGDTGAAGPAGAKGDTGAAGPAGAKGDTGAAGPAGAKGDTGAAGATGAQGPQGAQGLVGAQGPQGPQGPAGPTIPANIIAIPKGSTAAMQPVIVETGTGKPELVIYGSGFPPGNFILVTMDTGERTGYMDIKSGDQLVTAAGTFVSTVAPSKVFTVPAGVHTLQVEAGPSGVVASTAVVMVAPKQ